MKPDTTAATLNQQRDIRNWAMLAVFLTFLTLVGRVQGQTTTTIYQDTFSRTGLLNGSAPDTVDANGATWLAGPLIWTGTWTDQNGNTENAAFLSNSLPVAVPGPIYSEAYLPINVETGHVYTITASILVNTNFGVNWIALGYSSCPTLQLIQNDYSLWMLVRSTNAPNGGTLANQNNGNLQTFTGASTGGGVTYNWTNSSGVINPQFITYSLVLNLTNVSAITGYWFTNGVPIRTNNFGSSFPGANNGMWPHFLAFAQTPGCAGYITNLMFTDVVPFPTAPTIVEQPNNLTAPQGQTATFWVNAVSTPDPSYQWMSNNVAITGATNATYTTPPLSSSFNGAGYSVQVVNVAGPVTSSSATLTVTAGNPTVDSATKTASPTTIVVNFSGAVDPTTSQNAANYTLNNGASVSSVSAGSVPSSVVLTTSTLNPAASYDVTVKNVQDTFGDVMTASTNAVLPAGLVLDLRGDSGVQLDASGNVAQWADQTTNGNNASQFFGMPLATSGLNVPSPQARPTTGTTINGLGALTFNAGNRTFLTAASTPSLSINTNLTIYCVAKVSDTSISRFLLGKTVGNIPASYELDAVNNGTNPGTVETDLISGDAGAGNTAASGGSGIVALPHVFAITRAFAFTYTNNYGAAPAFSTNTYYTCSNTVSVYFDGLEMVSNAASTVGAPGFTDGQQPLYIGMRQDHFASDLMNGQIAQILVFNTNLSAADMTNLDNFLGQKWFTFNFITAVPTITTSNGFAVTISPGPSYGSVHFAGYQWQENGANISGANGASYTTPILAPSDNGDTFSLIVTLYNGATYTNTTTLDVLNEPPYVTSAGMPLWALTTNIVVQFDEAVTPATATVAANYSLNNGASVLSAAMGNSPNQVILTTSALTWNENPGFYTLTAQNVQDVYGNTMVTAGTPVGLYPTGVGLWIKANTGVTAANGNNGNVSQWNDLSGNGNNLSVLSSTYPVLTNNAFGDTVVRFTGTNNGVNFNQMYASSASSIALTGDLTIAAVVNFATLAGSTNGDIVSKTGAGGSANQPAPYDCSVGTDETLLRGNGSSNGSFTATNPPSVGQPHILIATESGNTITFYLDGQPAGTGQLSNGFQEGRAADAGQALFIGGRGDNHNHLTGDLAELIVIGSGLSANDAASLNNYLYFAHNAVQTNATKLGFSVSGGNLTLSWPFNHTGWQLQAQTNSVSVGISNNWVNVTSSTNVNQMVVPVNLNNGTVFYRLVYP